VRGEFAKTFLDSSGNPSRGIFAAYLKEVGGSVKVNLNATRRSEVASSFKSLHLLHSMRRVAAGTDTLASAFNYYEYDPVKGKDACPDPSKEIAANLRTNYNFEQGLDQMMSISDNRTTRGTVIRYGGFAPFNTTASSLGLTGTTLRHNIGCAYYNLVTGKYTPATLRNDTTAADLSRIYEGVWDSTLLSNTNSARAEFPRVGESRAAVSARRCRRSSTRKRPSSASRRGRGQLRQPGAHWGKGGSYGTCLPDASERAEGHHPLGHRPDPPADQGGGPSRSTAPTRSHASSRTRRCRTGATRSRRPTATPTAPVVERAVPSTRSAPR
jgi:hypothetical protein